MTTKESWRLRCLFVADDHPLTPTPTGGGPVLLYRHLELLYHAGIDVVLVLLEHRRFSYGFRTYRDSHPEKWAKVRSWLSADPVIVPVADPPIPRRLRRMLIALRSPADYVYPDVGKAQRAALRSVIAEHSPHFLWAELLHPAVAAQHAAPELPLIYSHQDWHWQIFRILARKLGPVRSWFHAWVRKRVEEDLVRRVYACVSGSATESAELTRLGVRRVLYLPPIAEPIPSSGKAVEESRPRVVQFGGMKTAANQIGVERFLQRVWPVVLQEETQPPPLWVIGPMEGASASLARNLENAQAICPGHVEDLDSVLRPGDIHVIPWERDTGTRTRVPVALNYRQALISTRAAAACLPELTSGKDCILVEDLESMGREIVRLLRDRPLRCGLAQAGRETFLKHFTREAVQPSFDRFLQELRSDLGTED